MQNDKQNKSSAAEQQQPLQEGPAKPINLNDYAGDAEDDKSAREQASNYTEDLDHRNTGKATREE